MTEKISQQDHCHDWVCPLCQSVGAEKPVAGKPLSILRCPQCRSGFVDSPHIDGDHCEEYANVYEEELDPNKSKHCWQLFEKLVPAWSQARDILDIGCGRGGFLDIAKEHRLKTYGMEVSEKTAAVANSKGHRIYTVTCEDPINDGLHVDIVTLWDVLEHIPTPRDVLERCARLLRPGGTLVILTPLMGSVYDRVGLFLSRLSGRRSNHLIRLCWSQDHVCRYQPDGLSRELKTMGFTGIHYKRMVLFSLMPDSYASGAILPKLTGLRSLDATISRAGVFAAHKLGIYNKFAMVATRANPV